MDLFDTSTITPGDFQSAFIRFSSFQNLLVAESSPSSILLYSWLSVHTGYKMLENTDLKLSVFQHFFILVSY